MKLGFASTALAWVFLVAVPIFAQKTPTTGDVRADIFDTKKVTIEVMREYGYTKEGSCKGQLLFGEPGSAYQILVKLQEQKDKTQISMIHALNIDACWDGTGEDALHTTIEGSDFAKRERAKYLSVVKKRADALAAQSVN